MDCGTRAEPWQCLATGGVRCSRYTAGHAVVHGEGALGDANRCAPSPVVLWESGGQRAAQGGCCREVRDAKEQTRWPSCTVVPLGKLTLRGDEGHCLALSWSDLSVWCYACDSYIKHNTLEPLLIRAHEIKCATLAVEQFPSTMFCNVL